MMVTGVGGDTAQKANTGRQASSLPLLLLVEMKKKIRPAAGILREIAN
ncbi:hypothetical protein [Neomoorella glycerini]|nr:hypothetical protein [Moorella glycerini]